MTTLTFVDSFIWNLGIAVLLGCIAKTLNSGANCINLHLGNEILWLKERRAFPRTSAVPMIEIPIE
jgi:hypothetical protein